MSFGKVFCAGAGSAPFESRVRGRNFLGLELSPLVRYRCEVWPAWDVRDSVLTHFWDEKKKASPGIRLLDVGRIIQLHGVANCLVSIGHRHVRRLPSLTLGETVKLRLSRYRDP